MGLGCFSHIKDLIKVKKEVNIKKNIVLIGAGYTGQIIIKQVLSQNKSPIRIVGLLDDDDKKYGHKLHGKTVLGSVKDLVNLPFSYDEIYICIPSATPMQMMAIVEDQKNKTFQNLPSFSELINGNISISQLRNVSILDLLGRKEVNLDESLIKELIKGKRILITGAGGSIGSG